MLGDTAIAVHPNDDRYKVFTLCISRLYAKLYTQHLHYKFAVHPFVHRRIPIIPDEAVAEMGFGGVDAVKISPAHDYRDHEVGVRHNLQFVNILNDDGTLNSNAGDMFM